MENNPTSLTVVAGLMRDGQGRFLLQRRPDHKQHGGLWEFPGGKVEAGETSQAALVRELNEELRILVREEALAEIAAAEGADEGANRAIVIKLYKVSAWVGAPRPDPDAKIGWFAASEVSSLPMPPLDMALLAQLPA
ncbi:(deoxy)nucleoside triphosphate pyrophosphohydrolase [Tsuneonella mangrovi]|uniref:(deoxy)nucleoside triphosphate pyrophosphohydrolase n=1 Tax=Tsuneonella mangrovi TaxID=1982042 RepID=UPI001F0A2C0E|nr:(deoxy)nucleoside triphosphate pyrophosphohydrolase [Tsuneonella mangrovi]